jgi:hypothetical protein
MAAFDSDAFDTDAFSSDAFDFGAGAGGLDEAISDLTTAFTAWCVANNVYGNEDIRAALQTLYSTSNQDFTSLLRRLLNREQ